MTNPLSSKFQDQWKYHQKQFWSEVLNTTKSFLIYFPLGYLLFIWTAIIALLSFPIVLGRGLKNWIQTALVRELTPSDIAHLQDEILRKQAIKNYHFSIYALSKTLVFLSGVAATLIGLILGKILR